MVRFLADENLHDAIVRGLRLRLPEVDIVRVQDIGFRSTDDRAILEWAAAEQRVVLTHDVSTMTGFAHERVRAGKPMPGLFEISDALPLGRVIEDLVLVAECSLPGE